MMDFRRLGLILKYFILFQLLLCDMEKNLTLSEKILLLAIRPEKGGYFMEASSALQYSLTGALFLEMERAGNISFEDKLIRLKSTRTDSPVVAYLIEKLSASSKPRRIGYWLTALSISKPKVKRGLLDALEAKREVRLADRKFLFFKWKKVYLQSGNSSSSLVHDIRRMIMKPADSVDDIYFLSMVEASKLLSRIFPDRHQRKNARDKIKQLKTGSQVPEAVRMAIQTAAAIAASVTVNTALSAAARR